MPWCCPTKHCPRTCSVSPSSPASGASNTPTVRWCWSGKGPPKGDGNTYFKKISISIALADRFPRYQTAAIIIHKLPFPPSAAARHSLRLHQILALFSRDRLNVPQAEIRVAAQHLCLRIRADGEGHGLSRIRRALVVPEGNQPDGNPGAGHGTGRADRGARRQPGIVTGHDF